ncbi:MAG: hypothetical protein IJF16_07095 [Clostridia bacterium]|nr:hypothetical protein [Clostridia bacterium]
MEQYIKTEGKGNMKQRGSTRQELEIWGFAPNIFKRFTNETNNYIKLLKDLYSSLKISTDSYGEGKSKGGISDPTASTVERIAQRAKVYKELLQDIENQEAALKEKVQLIDSILMTLPVKQREVIVYRYRRRYEWNDIAVKFEMSSRQAHRVEAAAVERIEAELKKHLPQEE